MGDSSQMYPMLDPLSENCDQLPEQSIADASYRSRDDTPRDEQGDVQLHSPIKKEQRLLEEGSDPYALE